MALLDELLSQMRVAPELSDIQIVQNEVVDEETFVFKVITRVWQTPRIISMIKLGISTHLR